ncbi:putative fgf receptor activating protein [Fasciola gigantica]|uniref:Putative fgf receptor activating protein n=1 Tax=Fasciola gigantica TaxID=46835 RepID=A0A504YXV6_FASGI|nr:putative fgf receptor activating protein [Fasciola gigantica]
MKLLFFITTVLLIGILLYHFHAHRFLCRPNAFSWFSATEYGIAVANMGFHLTAAYDFQDVILTTTFQKSRAD